MIELQVLLDSGWMQMRTHSTPSIENLLREVRLAPVGANGLDGSALAFTATVLSLCGMHRILEDTTWLRELCSNGSHRCRRMVLGQKNIIDSLGRESINERHGEHDEEVALTGPVFAHLAFSSANFVCCRHCRSLL